MTKGIHMAISRLRIFVNVLPLRDCQGHFYFGNGLHNVPSRRTVSWLLIT